MCTCQCLLLPSARVRSDFEEAGLVAYMGNNVLGDICHFGDCNDCSNKCEKVEVPGKERSYHCVYASLRILASCICLYIANAYYTHLLVKSSTAVTGE